MPDATEMIEKTGVGRSDVQNNKHKEIIAGLPPATEDKKPLKGLQKFFSRKEKKDESTPESKENLEQNKEEKKPDTPVNDDSKKEPVVDESTKTEKQEKSTKSIEDILSSLDESSRAVVQSLIDSNKESEKKTQSLVNSKESEVKELTQNLSDLKSKFDSLNEELDKTKNERRKVAADDWVKEFDSQIKEDEVAGMMSLSKSLYSKFSELDDAINALRSELKKSSTSQDEAIKSNSINILEHIERRLNNDYDDIVGKVKDEDLLGFLKSDSKVAEAFTEEKDKFGVANAKFNLAKKKLKIQEFMDNPDGFIDNQIEGKKKKQNGSGEEEKKEEVSIAALTSSKPSKNDKNEPIAATPFAKIFAKRRLSTRRT